MFSRLPVTFFLSHFVTKLGAFRGQMTSSVCVQYLRLDLATQAKSYTQKRLTGCTCQFTTEHNRTSKIIY